MTGWLCLSFHQLFKTTFGSFNSILQIRKLRYKDCRNFAKSPKVTGSCVDNPLVCLVPKPMPFPLHQDLLIELITKIDILMAAIPKTGTITSVSLKKSN